MFWSDHIFKEKLDQDPGLRIRRLGAAFRYGLFDSPETAIGHQVPIFIKIGLGVPLQDEGTLVRVEGYAYMDRGWLEPGHNHRDEKEHQRG